MLGCVKNIAAISIGLKSSSVIQVRNKILDDISGVQARELLCLRVPNSLNVFIFIVYLHTKITNINCLGIKNLLYIR